LLASCAAGIPAQLAEQVSWNLSFTDLRRSPEAYQGRIVALGGIVTHIEANDGGYRVLVNEVPLELSGRSRPAVDQLPRGRFMLLLLAPVLPSGFRPGAEVTVVGEVLRADARLERQVDGRGPVLEARHVKVWGPSWWPRVHIGVGGDIGI
jgi:starvation-inducible outer membrane lipoprotein